MDIIKVILIPMISLLLSFALSMLITRLITWKWRKAGTLTKRRRVVTFLLVLVFLIILTFFLYFNSYSRAGDRALKAMEGSATVKVESIDQGYRFDGPGTQDAMIYYPGAMVDEKAYAEMMLKLAEQGVDCFLIKMPLHMAFMGREKATGVLDEYGNQYEHWYMSGHSLGGAIAAMYTAAHKDRLAGGIFMAAYSVEPLPDSLNIATITATRDEVMNWDDYHKNQNNLPENAHEITIEGGNHSQFGDYGLQRGDGEATISPEEQLEQVCDTVLSIIRSSGTDASE